MYEYKAEYIKNYDGDTIDFKVDLGFNISFEIKVRLSDIDTYELRESDESLKALAYEAKHFVAEKLSNAEEVIIQTKKDKTGKYGRYLATVIYDGLDLNKTLLELGYAKEY